MTKRVITTVGTSIFTNYMKEDVRKQLDKEGGYTSIDNIYRQLENAEIGADTSDLEGIIKKIWLVKFRPEASAEINSLLNIAKNELLEVHLIATETALSVAACKLIKHYLASELNEQKAQFQAIHFDKKKDFVKGLQVKDPEKFESEGFLNLVDAIKSIKGEHNNTILNISGGYKALIPPLTIVAQLYEIPLLYLYEDSDKPIEIGTFPIGYDWFAIEKFSILLHKTPQARQNSKVKEVVNEMIAFKLVKPDTYDLTILGNLLKQYLENRSTPPLTGTMMGYFVEHKLYKYFQEKYGRSKVEHSYEPIKDMGDIDLKIDAKEGFIPIEIKPVNVCEDGFGTWENLLKKFPERINLVIPILEKSPEEIWLILYGEQKPESDFTSMTKALSQFDCPFKVSFLKIKPSKLNIERHVYQNFFKNDIDDSMLEEIYNSQNFLNHV